MAFFKVLVATVAMAACAIASPAAPAPYHAPAPYGAPEAYADVAPVYNYQYGVNDANYGPVFSHSEDRENYNTKGEYRVNLPDGRVQIVSYTAGPEGYVADVKYEGVAAYPEYKPTYKVHPAPAYKAHPAPAYKPLPKPVYKPAPAPVYKAHPAPVYHKPAPVYAPHPAPVYHKPAYHAAPVYHKPAHVYAPHPAPAYKPKSKYSFAVVTEAPAVVAKAAPAAEVVEEVAAPAEA